MNQSSTFTVPLETAALLDAVPALAGDRVVSCLPGGLTNLNYKVETAQGIFVARVSSPETSLLSINRQSEYFNSVAAASARVAPDVVDYLAGRGLLVIRYINGQTYTPSDVGANLNKIAALCRQLHQGPRFAADFDMFAIQRFYLQTVQQRGFRLPARYLVFTPMVAMMRQSLNAYPVNTVPCHNDLLAANFIDDGTRLWLIDYEYAGNNDPCFELGNIWSESTLAEDQLVELVDSYYGQHRPALVARARLQAMLAQYGWMLWASIQDGISQMDFDFWSWGLEKYERAVEGFDSPQFRALLEVAAQPH